MERLKKSPTWLSVLSVLLLSSDVRIDSDNIKSPALPSSSAETISQKKEAGTVEKTAKTTSERIRLACGYPLPENLDFLSKTVEGRKCIRKVVLDALGRFDVSRKKEPGLYRAVKIHHLLRPKDLDGEKHGMITRRPDGTFLYALWDKGRGTYITTTGKRLPVRWHDQMPVKGTSVWEILTRFSWPTEGTRITSPFGLRRGKKHEGLDIGVNSHDKIDSTSVWASDVGTVDHAGYLHKYGNTIIVRHADGWFTLYAHLKTIDRQIKKGYVVAKGEKMGVIGQTGSATGPHLHFEIRRCRDLENCSRAKKHNDLFDPAILVMTDGVMHSPSMVATGGGR